jgi:amidase
MSPAPDLARTTAAGLAAGLRKKSFSAAELVEACISRIEALDPQVNAVVVRDFDRARADARQADMALAKGDARPLLGVPATVKESFDLRGHPSTWGFTEHIEHRAREDALAVQRLKAAGAIVLGKTNVPPALADWQSNNPIYGRTNNPHDLTRSAGGSSGGSAAAIAMGFSALEIGSDIGGSVRVPAAFCGVYGHKTSYGVIPMVGHAYGGIVSNPAPLSVLGPLARSAPDLQLILQAIAGPDAEAPANKLTLPPARHGGLKSFRVFVMEQHPAVGCDSEIRGAIEELADRLTKEGANVARQSSLLPDQQKSWKTYQALLHTVTTRRAASPEGMARPPISAHDWLGHLDAQLILRRQWAEFFRHFDIVVCPAFGTAAFPHTDEPDWRKRSLDMDGQATNYGAQLGWASIASVGNLPSTAIPLGVNSKGLPLAAQAIGPFLEDLTTIAFAGMVGHTVATPKIAD